MFAAMRRRGEEALFLVFFIIFGFFFILFVMFISFLNCDSYCLSFFFCFVIFPHLCPRGYSSYIKVSR